MSATRDWMCRTNSRSTASRSSRMGSKIWARSARRVAEFWVMSVKDDLSKTRFTILDERAGCQRAKPFQRRYLSVQSGEERVEVVRDLPRQFDGRDPPESGQAVDHLGDECGLVPLAAMG